MIPLANPITTAAGDLVNSIFVAKGTVLRVPIMCLNRSDVLWGKDGKDFVPERWLDDSDGMTQQRAMEIQGHRHLLTFVDGPRACLGKNFALTEFKVRSLLCLLRFSGLDYFESRRYCRF